MDRAPGNVDAAVDDPRVTCIRAGGGKTLRALGYELPHCVGWRPAFIADVAQQ